MKAILPILTIVLALLLLGCEANTTPLLECAAPLIYSGDRCCMDADSNGVCDVDEQAAPAEEQQPVEEKTSEEIVESGTKTKEDAEAVAKLFADKWNVRSYNMMYSMFSEKLKAKKTVDEFKTVLALESMYKKVEKVSFQGSTVKDGDSSGDVTFIAETTVQQFKIPSVKLVYEDNAWRISGFPDIFDMDTFEAACGAYDVDARYTIEECAKDFAISMDDSSYCEQAGCFYIECMEKTGQAITTKVKANKCDKCPELYDSKADCLLELAKDEDDISVCNNIKESRYSDRYCTCYGGFALHKNSNAYCNMIPDPEYKELCLKKYNGEYC